jgi:ATPase subunit of ABC transporter with duplicated ATPase domains
MRPLSFLATAVLLACHSPATLAATMYKCVDASGKVAYVSQPCDGARNTAKTFDVAPANQGRPKRYERGYTRYEREMSEYERAEMERIEVRKREAAREAAVLAREKEAEEAHRRQVASALDARNAKLRAEAEQRKKAELAEYERWQKINGKVQK